MADRAGAPTPDLRPTIHEQLKLILHATECGTLIASRSCTETPCARIKQLLEHIGNCERGRDCDTEGCFQTRKLKTHWDECINEQCSLCVTVSSGLSWEASDAIEPTPPRGDMAAERQKILLDQLELLLHAHKCQFESLKTARVGDCELPNCTIIRSVISHVACCELKGACVFPSCRKTQIALAHWTSCTEARCLICPPMTRIEDMRRGYLVAKVQPVERSKRQLFVWQHIKHVMHVYACIAREREAGGDADVKQRCSWPTCGLMRRMLDHLPGCDEGNMCRVPLCRSSRRILEHWSECLAPDCPACSELLDDPAEQPSALPSASSSASKPIAEAVVPLKRHCSPLLKMAQRQLLILLHAQKCSRNGKTGCDVSPCVVPRCSRTKALVNHMQECDAHQHCDVSQCTLSRMILDHWKNCRASDCEFCFAMKHASGYANANENAEDGADAEASQKFFDYVEKHAEAELADATEPQH